MLRELRKYSGNLECILSDNIEDKIPKKVFKWHGDYIICFRSYFILPKSFLSKASIAAINFHPGTPQYRGIGCVNFAIFNSEKFYGSTCHLMSKKIDFGKIIDVQRFKLNKKDDVNSILKKTYKLQFFQFKKIIKYLSKNKKSSLNLMIKKSKKEKWSKKFYTRKLLNKLYKINYETKMKIKNLDRYLRSTVTEKFIPHVELNYEEK